MELKKFIVATLVFSIAIIGCSNTKNDNKVHYWKNVEIVDGCQFVVFAKHNALSALHHPKCDNHD